MRFHLGKFKSRTEGILLALHNTDMSISNRHQLIYYFYRSPFVGVKINSDSLREMKYSINFCGGGQIIALKSATTLILDRYNAL